MFPQNVSTYQITQHHSPKIPLLIATAVRTLTPKNQKDFAKNDCSVDEAYREKEFTETDINVTQN